MEQLQKEVGDLKYKIKTNEEKHKQEVQKMTQEKEELLKAITKVQHKETQYSHEIKSRDNQIAKLQDQIKNKLFDTKKGGNKENQGGEPGQSISTHAKILPSNDVKFSKMSSEGDMSLMISKSQEEIYKQQSQEINDLKDCLKMLQREMFDIVKLKSEIYMKRFKAENFDPNDKQAFSSEEIIKNEITSIKENLFNLNFEETGREII